MTVTHQCDLLEVGNKIRSPRKPSKPRNPIKPRKAKKAQGQGETRKTKQPKPRKAKTDKPRKPREAEEAKEKQGKPRNQGNPKETGCQGNQSRQLSKGIQESHDNSCSRIFQNRKNATRLCFKALFRKRFKDIFRAR